MHIRSLRIALRATRPRALSTAICSAPRLALPLALAATIASHSQGSLAGEPPPSFTEFRSACGSPLVLPGGASAFPDLDLPNNPPYGQGEDPPTPDPPSQSESLCICYLLEFPQQVYAIDRCGDPRDGDACGDPTLPPCNTGCLQIPFLDEDRDGEPWPLDEDESNSQEGSPFADTDGDRIPDAFDIMPNGDDPSAPDFKLQNGVLPNDTRVGQIIELLESLGMRADDGPGPQVLDQQWARLVSDENSDGVITLLEGAGEILKVLHEQVQSLESFQGRRELSLEELDEFLDRRWGVSSLAQVATTLLSQIAPEVLEGSLGEALELLSIDTSSKATELVRALHGGSQAHIVETVESAGGTVEFLESTDDLDRVRVVITLADGTQLDAGFIDAEHRNRIRKELLGSYTPDPVDTATGELVHEEQDLAIEGRGLPTVVRRVYRSRSVRRGILGRNWSMPLVETRALLWPGGRVIEVFWGDGTASQFVRLDGTGLFEGIGGEHGKIRVGFGVGDPDAEGHAPGLVLRKPDGSEYHFCDLGWVAGIGSASFTRLRKVSDPFGNAIVFRRDELGRVGEIVDTLGRTLTFVYDDERSLLVSIRDWTGATIDYFYDERDDLIEVQLPPVPHTLPDGSVRWDRPGSIYEYHEHPDGWDHNRGPRLNHNLRSIRQRGDAAPWLELEYGTVVGYAFDRVVRQILDGKVLELRYEPIGPGTPAGADPYQPETARHRTETIDAEGRRQVYVHGNGLLLRQETWNDRYTADGQPLGEPYVNPDESAFHQVWMTLMTYDQEERRVEVLRTSDALWPAGERKLFEYDDTAPDRAQRANVVRVTAEPWPADPAIPPRSWHFEYDPIANSPVHAIDPIGREWTRKLGHQELAYEEARQLGPVRDFELLPADPPPELLARFGLGDLNGDGLLCGLAPGEQGIGELGLAIVVAGPELEIADSAGPDGPSELVLPETIVRYDRFGRARAWFEPGLAWTEVDYSGGYARDLVQDPGGLARRWRQSRDAHGRIVRQESPDGRVLEIVRDGLGSVLAEVRHPRPYGPLDPLPAGMDVLPISLPEDLVDLPIESVQGFDLAGRLVSRSAPFHGGLSGGPVLVRSDREVERIETSATGLVTARVRIRRGPDGAVLTVGRTEFEYDSRGELVREILPGGAQQLYRFGPRGLLLEERRIDADGADLGATRYDYDVFGRRTAVTDAEGRRTRFVRDGFGRAVEERGPDGVYVQRRFDAADRLLVEEVRRGTSLLARTQFEYDALDRVVRERRTNLVLGPDDAVQIGTPAQIETLHGYGVAPGLRWWTVVDPGGRRQITRFEYDALGRLVAERRGDPVEVSVEYELDLEGRVLVERETLDGQGATGPIDPSVRETRHRYDRHGRLRVTIDPTGAVTHQWWGPEGEVRESLDALGRRTVFERDDGGLLLRLIEDVDGASGGRAFRWDYDASGRAIARIDPLGRRTELERDGFGRLIARRFPDGSQETFLYDRTDRLLVETRPGNVTVTRSLDAAGRIRELRASGADAGVVRRLERDGLGRIVRLVETVDGREPTRLEWWLDAMGLPRLETSALGEEPARVHAFLRDGTGLVLEHHFPSGEVVRRTWDALGRPRTLATTSTGLLATFALPYGSAWRRVDLAGGGTRRLEFDAAGRMHARVDFAADGTPLGGSTVEYDAVGNPRVRIRAHDGRRDEFDVDAFDRLREWRVAVPSSGPPARIVDFDFDAADNLIGRDDSTASGPENGSVDELDRLERFLPAISGFAHTPRGEEARREAQGTSLARAWDALGRPLVETALIGGVAVPVEWTRDGLDRPVRRFDPVRGERRYEYAGGDLVAVDDGHDTTLLVREVPGGAPLAELTSGASRFVLTDTTGNVVLRHDGQQALERYDYDPYGRPRRDDGSLLEGSALGVELFFLAAPCDLASGTVHLGPRALDTRLGRFTSRDPLCDKVRNLFTYARGNPLRFADPTGLAPIEVEGGGESGIFGNRFKNPVIDLSDNPVRLMDRTLGAPGAAFPGQIATYYEETDQLFGRRFIDLSDDEQAIVLKAFLDDPGNAPGTDPRIDWTRAWAEQGLAHIASFQRLDLALKIVDLPTTALSEGLQALGMSEGKADLTAQVTTFAFGGVFRKGTRGLFYTVRAAARHPGGALGAGRAILARAKKATSLFRRASGEARAARGRARFADPKFAAQLERQLARDGPSSVFKSLRSLEKRLAEHQAKLPDLQYKSSVEREIRTFQNQIDTLKEFISQQGLKP